MSIDSIPVRVMAIEQVAPKQHNMTGRTIAPAQIEPAAMQTRHDEISLEMVRRGYNHKSPYEQPDISYLPIEAQNAKVDMDYNYKDLAGRCAECKKRIIIERWRKQNDR